MLRCALMQDEHVLMSIGQYRRVRSRATLVYVNTCQSQGGLHEHHKTEARGRRPYAADPRAFLVFNHIAADHRAGCNQFALINQRGAYGVVSRHGALRRARYRANCTLIGRLTLGQPFQSSDDLRSFAEHRADPDSALRTLANRIRLDERQRLSDRRPAS